MRIIIVFFIILCFVSVDCIFAFAEIDRKQNGDGKIIVSDKKQIYKRPSYCKQSAAICSKILAIIPEASDTSDEEWKDKGSTIDIGEIKLSNNGMQYDVSFDCGNAGCNSRIINADGNTYTEILNYSGLLTVLKNTTNSFKNIHVLWHSGNYEWYDMFYMYDGRKYTINKTIKTLYSTRLPDKYNDRVIQYKGRCNNKDININIDKAGTITGKVVDYYLNNKEFGIEVLVVIVKNNKDTYLLYADPIRKTSIKKYLNNKIQIKWKLISNEFMFMTDIKI